MKEIKVQRTQYIFLTITEQEREYTRTEHGEKVNERGGIIWVERIGGEGRASEGGMKRKMEKISKKKIQAITQAASILLRLSPEQSR